jgi:MFS family permease
MVRLRRLQLSRNNHRKEFFAPGDERPALFDSFAAFAIGFIARPLGGLAIGWFADRAGRRTALTLTVARMAGDPPSSASRNLIALVNAGWVTPQDLAARVKFNLSATTWK